MAAAVRPLGYSPTEFAFAASSGCAPPCCPWPPRYCGPRTRPRDSRFSASPAARCRSGLPVSRVHHGWQGAIAGEALAGLLALLAARLGIRQAFAGAPSQPAARQLGSTTVDRAGGNRLYWATLSSSSTSLGDRALINALSGPAIAGTYGVLALIFQIGQLLVNILSQRVGPLIIKADSSEMIRMVRPETCVGNGPGWVCRAGGRGVRAGRQGPGSTQRFFRQVLISAVAIVGAGLVAMLQIYALLEFYLLAHDREDAVLVCSVSAAAFFFALFVLAGLLQLSLEWFVLACCSRARCKSACWQPPSGVPGCNERDLPVRQFHALGDFSIHPTVAVGRATLSRMPWCSAARYSYCATDRRCG